EGWDGGGDNPTFGTPVRLTALRLSASLERRPRSRRVGDAPITARNRPRKPDGGHHAKQAEVGIGGAGGGLGGRPPPDGGWGGGRAQARRRGCAGAGGGRSR